MVRVTDPKLDSGVDADHPSMVNAIKNMSQDGVSKQEDIMRVTGAPLQVIERHQKSAGLKAQD